MDSQRGAFVEMKIVTLFLLCVVCVMGQTTSVYSTQGAMNGRGWLALSENEKLVWVGAFDDGVMSARAFSLGESRKQLDENLACHLTYGEVRSALNHFYTDTPENGPIPVDEAWVVVTMKAQGASSAEIEKTTAKFRAVYSK